MEFLLKTEVSKTPIKNKKQLIVYFNKLFRFVSTLIILSQQSICN